MSGKHFPVWTRPERLRSEHGDTRKGNMSNAVKLDVTKLTYAEIAALEAKERFDLMSTGVRLVSRIATQQETERKVRPAYAKVVAALKRDHAKGQDEKSIPKDTTFRKYFAQNCGGDLPGRLEALATLFNTLCLVEINGKPLLAEATYDAHSTNSLEIANACISHAKEKHGDNWRSADDTLDVILALTQPGDATAKLKKIRESQKGVTEKTGGEPQPLTTAQAVAHLLAAIGAAKDMNETVAAELFADTLKIGNSWKTSGIAEDMLDKWMANLKRGVAPTMEIVTERRKPAAKAAPLAA